MLPKIALLGRPNVGKSTLFNRLIRSNRAITHDRPGVTRDRMEGVVRSRSGRSFTLIDTGGVTLDSHHSVADGPEGLALVLTEHLGNGDYETRLYAYQGAIVEEYTRAGTAFTPEKAREIVRSSTFDFTYTDGLLTVHTDQGSTSVALRSVRGGA